MQIWFCPLKDKNMVVPAVMREETPAITVDVPVNYSSLMKVHFFALLIGSVCVMFLSTPLTNRNSVC